MHKKRIQFYAKVIIFFSFVLIFYGVYLSFQNSFHSLDSVIIVSDADEDDSVVSITTIDGNEIVVEDSSQNNDSGLGKKEDRIQSQPIDYLAETNNSLRSEIEKQYGITIYYGDETAGYSVSGIYTTPIMDSSIISTQLTRLKNVLSLYPDSLFWEIRNGGIPLSIYLVNNYSENSITGVTDSSYNYAHISIAAIYPFEESFFHESYHYIERYMFKLGASFNSWSALNPEGFDYGSVYNQYSYVNTFLDSAPFVNNYAQSSDTEDRASTFEFMMASSKASCLNNGMTVWQKAIYMARTMEASLDSVNPNVLEYWERFL